MNNTIKNLCAKVAEKADALLILTSVNRRYVTSFQSSAGTVVVIGEKVVFYTDFRYFESVKRKQEAGIVDPSIELRLSDAKLMENIKHDLEGCKNVLFEENGITFGTYNYYKNALCDTELIPGGSAILSELRAVKTEFELDCIRKAQSITDKTFAYIVDFIANNAGKSDFTERALRLEMDYYMLKNGASSLAFDTIAISGTKTALPHGAPENVTIEKGFITMDFGAAFGGYCSDMTRTICVGNPTDEMRDVYETVRRAQDAAFEVIEAGIEGKLADKAARDIIEAKYPGTFGHSLGHSLGLEIHESPNFHSGEARLIPENAVLSVEPGIYLEGKFGVRIEDIVCLKQGGFENLTHSPKELIIV